MVDDDLLLVRFRTTIVLSGSESRQIGNIYVLVNLDNGEIVYVGLKPPEAVLEAGVDTFKELIVREMANALGLRNISRYVFNVVEIDPQDSNRLVAVKMYDREAWRWLQVTWIALIDPSGKVKYWKYIYGYAAEIAVDKDEGLVAFHLIRGGYEDYLEIYR